MKRPLSFIAFLCLSTLAIGQAIESLPKDDGYRGIWYQIKDPKGGPKYSGGFATYPQQIRPLAIYCKAVNKTFFVYGGRPRDKNMLLHMVSYYDHATGMVPRPTILLDKNTTDAHDNPALSIDDQGYLWVFSNTHGPQPRSSIHRSTKPYSIDAFEEVAPKISLSYGQPWFFPGHGFILVQNRYTDGRAVAFQTSPDGRAWSKPTLLAQMKVGHYQVSAPSDDGQKLGIAIDYHPHGLDTRTNLYFIETTDFGESWHDIAGRSLALPLSEVINTALVHNYEAESLLCYIKDLRYDRDGHPVILYLTSKGSSPGPAFGPHAWYTARWSGEAWTIRPVTTSDHDYDFGMIDFDYDGAWRIVATTDPGPKPYLTGGEIVLWTSADKGATWTRSRAITHDSALHQTFPRIPLNAQADFYALWADGDPTQLSDSHLYFANRDGSSVWELPTEMNEDFAMPIKIR